MKKQDKKIKGMGQVSDEDLVVAARNGDSQAMEALLLRYTSMVRSIARGYFLVGGDMEDLIQEGMIALYGAVKDYVFGSMRFKSFAYLCVTRRILDAVKASGRLKNKPLNNYVSLFDVDVDLHVADPRKRGRVLSKNQRSAFRF